ALCNSMKFFGVVEPIVVNRRSGNIVGGHQRVRAAEASGMDSLPVVYVDLDDPSEKQLNIALNRISGEFDLEKLAAVLGDLETVGADLGLTGFTDVEIEELCRGADDPMGGLTDPDAVPDPPDDPATQPGDLIVLGQHRLLCGDATDTKTAARLLGNEKATCMWTDPPYGVDYVGKTTDSLKIKNDSSEGLAALLASAFAAADTVLAPGAAMYVAHPAGRNSVVFGQAFLAAGWRLHQTLVWIKDTIVLGHSDYHYRHEPILFGYKPGDGRWGRGGKGWYGDNAQASVFEVPRPKASPDHPTSKPIDLIVRCLQNSSRKGAVVYEPFAGSGSTTIACEQLGRRCYAIEIDPRYCDVVVQRWQNFTGQKAESWRG
ncbi:MAG: DNA modification methylase, partial [Acidobacteria bacterium]|nr:DNA modification methylase [Acidobacteriota bacterium]